LPEHPVLWRAYGSNWIWCQSLGIRDIKRPSDIENFGLFHHLPTGGGPLLIGSGLRYGDDVKINPATEEIAVQFIAETQLAVNRAVVETWKALQEMIDPAVPAPYFDRLLRWVSTG